MKIKYSKEEFLSLHALGLKIINMAETVARLHFEDNKNRRQHQLDMLKRKGVPLSPTQDDEDEEDSNSDADSIWEDDASEAPAEDIHDNQLFDTIKEPIAVKPTSNPKGRKVAEELFNEWLINFNKEGDQPNRANLVDSLNKTMKGKYLYEYMKGSYESGTDLTLIVRDIYPAHISDDVVRHVTENFVQVTSILFPELSDFMKYPNPLTKEEF
jgi:hypothetical protein